MAEKVKSKIKEKGEKLRAPMTGKDWIKFIILMIISIVFIAPILLVLMNSFKGKLFVSNEPFAFPNAESFVGLKNYTNGIEKIDFFSAFFVSLFITVCSVILIVLATAMCAWFITRVKTWYTKLIYILFAFSMIVPFQMVMYPMSQVANTLHLDNMFGIVIIYLGFGAGLSVFMFAGFVKSVPLEIEEAAMIDGCHYTGRTDIGTNEACKQAVRYIFDENHDAVQHRIMYMYNPYIVQSAFHESQNYILTYQDVRFFDRWGY